MAVTNGRTNKVTATAKAGPGARARGQPGVRRSLRDQPPCPKVLVISGGPVIQASP
jgi:hypothetical protein